MRSRTAWFAAMVTVSLVGLGAPASADDSDDTGFLCGFTSTNDETGVVQQNPNVQFGEMDAGPMVAADFVDDGSAGPSHMEPTTAVVSCWIQVNNPTNGTGQDAANRGTSWSCQFQGTGVVVGACQISYIATDTDNVYLCAVVYNDHDATPVFVYDDDDDGTNGTQCSLAISAG